MKDSIVAGLISTIIGGIISGIILMHIENEYVGSLRTYSDYMLNSGLSNYGDLSYEKKIIEKTKELSPDLIRADKYMKDLVKTVSIDTQWRKSYSELLVLDSNIKLKWKTNTFTSIKESIDFLFVNDYTIVSKWNTGLYSDGNLLMNWSLKQ